MSRLSHVLAYLQYVYPKRFLSWFMMRWTRIRWPALRRFQISSFVAVFNVDLTDALEPDLDAYPDFNTFFTRPLRADARPLPDDPSAVVAPADGVVAGAGTLDEANAVQAKGQDYLIHTLLARPATPAFHNGRYFTVYLSPRDYHRVHACIDGRLTAIEFVPGALFSVSIATTRVIPRLFARNERAVLWFDTAHGPHALVLVGAVCVGSIETIWTGAMTPGEPAIHRFDTPIDVKRGQEVGRFNMGSTAIAVFPPAIALTPAWTGGQPIRMGETIASPDAAREPS